MHPSSVVRVSDTLPRARAPMLARDLVAEAPQRAQLFCAPFMLPFDQGVVVFPTVDLDFRVRAAGVDIRLTTDAGETFEKTITATGHVLISDVSPAWDAECRALYRERLSGEELPHTFDLDNPDYPKQLIEVTREEGSFGFAISIWTGAVIATDPGDQILIKEPAHTQAADRGFRVLEAVVESDRWHGHFGAVVHTYRTDTWLQVRRDEPLFQFLVYRLTDIQLEYASASDASQDAFVDPLRWNVFDPYRRNALRRGKYQADLRRLPAWDRDWRRHEKRFALRRADIDPETPLRLIGPATVAEAGDGVRVSFTAEDEISVDDARLAPFLIGLGHASGSFTGQDAIGWSRSGEPGFAAAEEIMDALRELIWHGLVIADRVQPSR